MITYSANGKGHGVLAFLDRGPATIAEIHQAVVPNASSRTRHRLWHLTGSLLKCRLIDRDGPFYVITSAGRDALQCLDGGFDFQTHEPAPSVRFFERSAA